MNRKKRMQPLCALKYYCRTCLMKLEECADGEGSKRCVAISKYPEVEQLIRVCSGKKNAEKDNDLDPHIPNLCRVCFDKWLDFAGHYQLLIKSNDKLRKLLDTGEVPIAETESESDCCDIEKYDTISPFYREDRGENPTSDTEECELFIALEDSTKQDHIQKVPKLLSEKADNSSNERPILEDIKSDDKDILISTGKSRRTRQANLSRECTPNRVKIKCKTNRKERTRIIPSKPVADSSDTTTKKVRYRCEPCKKYFYGIHKYEGHVKQVHEGIKKAYQCKDCNKAYHFYKNLRDHLALNHSAEPLETFKCEECNKMFKTKVTLKTHQTSKHQNNSKCIICDQCGFMAVNQYCLKKHIQNKHSVAEMIKCEQCPKVFKNPYYLKYHTLNFHNAMNIKPFKCTDCNMAFARIALLNVHKRTHLKHSERIKCDFEGCEVRFLFNGEKARHMRLVHLKVKQHICDICGEAFGTGPTLRHHRYIHTGEKPFKCTFCGQGFRQRSAMRTHQKTHGPKEEMVTRSPDIMRNLSEVNINLENTLK